MQHADSIRILCENTNSTLEVKMGTTLKEVLQIVGLNGKLPILAAYVNNRIKELHYKVYRPISIRFIDMSSHAGYRVYERTACFIMQRAVEELWPEKQLQVRHSLGQSGLYCEIEGMPGISNKEIAELERRMQLIVESDTPIYRHRMPTSEVRELYQRAGYSDKIELLDTRPRLYSVIYSMGKSIGFFYGALAPSTSYIKLFKLQHYHNGILLTLPSRSNPTQIAQNIVQEKMFDIFRDYKRWDEITGGENIGQINARILEGNAPEMIRMGEAIHEKCLSRIADTIYERYSEKGVRLILISGPSSSGKTTSAKRLSVHLQVLGLNPVIISLDDYFVNRDQTPRDESGDYDYEALEAIDLKLFNEQLLELYAGREVTIPRYNFITGMREWHETPLKLDQRSVLIVEGIHGLNPRLTPAIAEQMKFKIYVSCFTSVSMDNLSRIATTDNRLIRRMVRDYRQRGSNALSTLSRWASVRRGEEKHIFPYQENADVMFNSSLFYEFSVLRPLAEPILREVPDTVPEFNEANRLLHLLDNFTPIYDKKDIPPTSVLREFIGDSTFSY